jgi:predicted nucleic acid-binding protein
MEKGPVLILVDTSALIEYLNRTGSPYDTFIHEGVIEGGGNLCITDIVLTETLQGIKDDPVFGNAKAFLLAFYRFSLSCPYSYIEAAEIYRACRKKGLTIRRAADCLIAQVAIENDLELLHNDRDFERIAKVVKLKQVVI